MSNSEKLECVMQCEPEAYMEPLDPSLYAAARQTNDGTRKWYKCENCGSVFCLDKMTRRWQFSAETYTDLVEKGLLKDRLQN
jgi:hypothetical protein